MTPKRVVVTGATGLIGRAVLERLSSAPFETIGVARSAPEGQMKADLAEPRGAHAAAALRPNALVHLAGGASGDESELNESNVVATGNLLRALADLELRPYVIVAGSAAEYGQPEEGVLDEESPLAPLTAYGRVKAAQTRLAQRECERAQIPLTVVRPFNIVSCELPVSSALGNVRHQLLTQDGSPRKLRCGRLDVVRDYVSVTFVADAVARLLELSNPPTVLNVCSGIGIELRAIVDAIAEALAVDLEIEQDPALAAIPAAPRVIGNPARLAGIGLKYRPTPAELAAVLLGQ